MKLKSLFFGIVFILLSPLLFAHSDHLDGPNAQDIHQFLTELFNDNNAHVRALSHEHLSNYAEQQSPRTTVLMCSDSRVQSGAFHRSPINDMFFIRNIGNQIKSNEGSIEYGVEHLHTPILLIIGHSQCGAIKTALGDYSSLSLPIRQELNNLVLTKENKDVDDGVIENVHYQVKYAMEKFKDKIQNHQLVVIGTIYDFRDDFKHGHGKLILIDINGEKDPKKLQESEFIKGIKDIAVGEARGK